MPNDVWVGEGVTPLPWYPGPNWAPHIATRIGLAEMSLHTGGGVLEPTTRANLGYLLKSANLFPMVCGALDALVRDMPECLPSPDNHAPLDCPVCTARHALRLARNKT